MWSRQLGGKGDQCPRKLLLWTHPHFRRNFGRLVLGCINTDWTDFCNQILISKHFSRSSRFTNLCTAPDSKFADFLDFSCKISENFRDFGFCKILPKSSKICYYSPRFSWIFAGISQNFINFDVIDVAILNFQNYFLRKSRDLAETYRNILQKFSR